MSTESRNSLKSKVEQFPKKPGIYFFKNKKGKVVYIGKARSLKDRVTSYFLSSADSKVHNILSETSDIDFILTDSEKEAAFLENNFVQQYQPKFNLRLKDDKSFPYLKINLQEEYPSVSLTRRVKPDHSRYFGPFNPPNQAKKTIHLLNRYFGIRNCKEEIPGKRKRPCLEYELNLCSAPCVNYISKSEYKERVENALLFLEGKSQKLLKVLRNKMKEAADHQDYEQAAHWRDLIHTIEEIKEKPKLTSTQQENKDIFGFFKENGRAALYVFIMRKGKVRESRSILVPETKGMSTQKILSSQLEQYYQSHQIPEKILLPFTPEKNFQLIQNFSKKRGKKVDIRSPQRGKNKRLVNLAQSNAKAVLTQKSGDLNPLSELKNILGLESLPQRIEGFDISNIGGQESVASLVVFEEGAPDKDQYRKYKIKTVQGADDAASIYEVIHRRYQRLLRENQTFPQLILVDGGKPQLSAASKALEDLQWTNLPVISIAKKEELIYTPFVKNGISLDRHSPALKLVQMVRDEAHRFAISFHRKRREKQSFSSPLEQVPGIGKKKKAALLSRYKTLKNIQKAPPKELAQIIGPRTAHELKKRLKKKEAPTP
ncbi:excinuclease ABC subunit UvrC [bacterium]|nr:excinuclease ABC subunit UvrC [bacterium]